MALAGYCYVRYYRGGGRDRKVGNEELKDYLPVKSYV